MRVLVIQESDWLDRGPHQQHHLMERISSLGNEVRVIDFEITWKTKPRKHFHSHREIIKDVHKTWTKGHVNIFRPGIVKLPLLDYMSIIFTHSKEIRRQILEFKPDVIVGLGILNTYIAMRMAKRYKIPFLYYLIDSLHALMPVKQLRPLAKMLESNTLRHSDLVCVISEGLKQYAVNLGAQPEKIRIIKAGIDTERFNPSLDGNSLRRKLGLDTDDVVLFFMGWLYPFSGLKEVSEELVRVKGSYPQLKLLVVGEGEIYSELEEFGERLGGRRLVLVGWQPYEKVPEYIAAADICLLPAHFNEVMKDIVPIKMYEYMACGKPVISTRLPGVLKEFGHDNGVIYADGPAEVLQKAVELCNGDGSKIRECGDKARKLVEDYSWDRITETFEEILNDLAKKRRADRLSDHEAAD